MGFGGRDRTGGCRPGVPGGRAGVRTFREVEAAEEGDEAAVRRRGVRQRRRVAHDGLLVVGEERGGHGAVGEAVALATATLQHLAADVGAGKVGARDLVVCLHHALPAAAQQRRETADRLRQVQARLVVPDLHACGPHAPACLTANTGELCTLTATG